MSARLDRCAECSPVILALSLCGCSEWSLGSRDPETRDPVVVVETFVQAPLPKVDLLWVIDNTSSMTDEHAALAGALDAFADTLTGIGLSWQLGVITADISGVNAGVLQGDPWILTPALESPGAALLEAADVGTTGAPPEAGLGAAWLALNDPLKSSSNRAFRRDDASLHVIVLSDSDDDSASVLGEDPGAAFVAFLDDEEARTGLSAIFSAVVGDTPSGCTWDGGTALPGTTYAEVAAATGGVVASVCDGDLSEVVEALGQSSATWPSVFQLQGDPDPQSLRVSVNGARLDEGWALDADTPAIVFDEPPPPSAEIAVRYEVAEP